MDGTGKEEDRIIMALASMTGFARTAGELNGDTWTWEIKSVNGRGLDIRTRLAPGYDNIEPKIRSYIAEHISRGQLSVNLQLNTATREQSIHVNQQALEAIISAAGELQRDHVAIAPTALQKWLRKNPMNLSTRISLL